MTNALGIAAVTAVLKDRLNNAVIDADVVEGVRVSARPPEFLRRTGAEPSNRLNLFLYRVERNQGWINECLPERRVSGERVARSYLALDLHYLMSAYGDNDMIAEILLGYGMQVLHETPFLDREAIRRSLGTGNVDADILPGEFKVLSPANLADQVEQVKLTHHSLPPEEEWRLWSALNTGLRPSATYKASVVLIESDVSTQSALPVRQARIGVEQIRRPHIDRLQSSIMAGTPPLDRAPIRRGHVVILHGSGLRGTDTVVRLGPLDVAPAAGDVTDTKILVVLPNELDPGLVSAQVVHRIPRPLPLGTPDLDPAPQGDDTPMIGELSNAVAIPLSVGVAPQGATDTAAIAVAGGVASGDLVVQFDHPVGARQRISLSLNEFDAPAQRPAHAFTVDASAPAPDVARLASATFALAGIPAAEYLVRIGIDGVDSELFVENGRFARPRIDLT